jgi:hypothetical protein
MRMQWLSYIGIAQNQRNLERILLLFRWAEP